MKPKILLTFLFILNLMAGICQTHPVGINYQAVARDAQGEELASTSLKVRFSIILNEVGGTVEWQEIQSPTTNKFGLFSIILGQGERQTGTATTFDQITWSSGTHYLKVEVDFGNGYVDLGTTQMTAVPYALYADKAGNTSSGGITAITYDPSLYTLSADGKVVADLSNIKTEATQNLSLKGNTLTISDGNSLTLPHSYLLLEGNKLSLRQDTATYGSYTIDTDSTNEIQHLAYNGKYITLDKSGGSVYDADTSATNELITSATFDGTNIHITEAGTDHQIDLTSLKKTPWVGFSYNVSNTSFTNITPQEIVFSERIYDNMSSFNSTNFVTPQEGAYFFSLNLVFVGVNPVTINILKNGTSIKSYPAINQPTLAITLILDLLTNDSIAIQETNLYSGETVTIYNGSFSGYQVH